MTDKIGHKVQAGLSTVEERIGGGTGDHSMQARGATHREEHNFTSRFSAFRNWLSGGGSRVKGHAKSSGGALTGNHSAEAKGHLGSLKGDLKQSVNH